MMLHVYCIGVLTAMRFHEMSKIGMRLSLVITLIRNFPFTRATVALLTCGTDTPDDARHTISSSRSRLPYPRVMASTQKQTPLFFLDYRTRLLFLPCMPSCRDRQLLATAAPLARTVQYGVSVTLERRRLRMKVSVSR